MKHKYRGNSKIKREHDIIEGLDEYLQKIEIIPEVQSIIPSIITRRKGTGGLKFTVQRTTEHGLRCLAKNQGKFFLCFLPIFKWSLLSDPVGPEPGLERNGRAALNAALQRAGNQPIQFGSLPSHDRSNPVADEYWHRPQDLRDGSGKGSG